MVAVMTDYRSRINSLPEDLIFKAYLQRAIDHLSLVYDPAYSSQEINTTWGRNRPIMRCIYELDVNRWEYIPERFQKGENVLEYAKNLLPQIGGRKNLEYLPFLIFFSAYCHRTTFDFVIPEGGVSVTPENMGEVAHDRFPTLHGENWVLATGTETFNHWRWHLYPLNLNGDVCRTASKSQMAYLFDQILDRSSAIIHQDDPFYKVDEPDYWKKTDIYCTFCTEQYGDDQLISKRETADFPFRGTIEAWTGGSFGWKDWDPNQIYKRSYKIKVDITSKSPFRYKFIVFANTREDYDGSYERCGYDFAHIPGKTGKTSVIYESPDWITGNASWHYMFNPGPKPDWDTEKSWQVSFEGTYVIIYPEYPDRLKELLEQE